MKTMKSAFAACLLAALWCMTCGAAEAEETAQAQAATEATVPEKAQAAQDELEGKAPVAQPKKDESPKAPAAKQEAAKADPKKEQAAEKAPQKEQPKESEEEPPKPFTVEDQPRSFTIPSVLYGFWLNLFLGYGFEEGNDLARSGKEKRQNLIHINAAGGFGVLDNTLGMDFRVVFDGMEGARNGFRLNSFGTTLHYTFYNKKPLTQTVNLDLDFDNQFFTKFYSFDVVRVRPSYILGIGVWRFSFMPFIGVPMYIDANKKNDSRQFADRTLYDWDKYHNFMGGFDYGVPISFNVWRERLLLSFDTTGQTMLWGTVGKPQTTFWVTPGVRFNFMIALNVGFQYMLWSSNETLKKSQRWQIVAQGGFAF